ncbi:MAG: response regulator, partial [Deltaproteobacteria bacterium]|nr:response regulator [Deltaproteobacteria bacterium]
MNRYTILIVDDEPNILEALKRIFQKEYTLLTAASAKEGLDCLAKNKEIALIICDQRMPEMTGVEMLEKSRFICPNAVRILLTGYSDIEAVISAINRGHIYKYLTKPWENEAIKLEVKNALEYYDFKRAKDQFLMLISHELKTPLTTILGFTEGYLRGLAQTAEEKEHFILRIEEGAKKLSKLIEDTLDLVTTQSGAVSLQKVPTSLKTVVEQILADAHDQITQKKILVETPLEEGTTSLDEALMKKALSKILEYALTASDEGGKVSIISQKNSALTITIAHRGELLTPE